MISDARRQFSSSATSCFLPARVVELELIAADLLNPPGNTVPVQWPERAEGFQNHQVERTGQDFVLLLFHMTPVDEQQKFKPIPVGSQHYKLETQLVPQLRILLACDPVDFRKGIDSRAALCKGQLGHIASPPGGLFK
jgi:hypothetical protein